MAQKRRQLAVIRGVFCAVVMMAQRGLPSEVNSIDWMSMGSPVIQAANDGEASSPLSLSAKAVRSFGGKKAPATPWGGRTLEWQCASPPPFDNFAKTPRAADPYDFSVVKWDEKTQGYWVDDSADPEMNPNAPKAAHAHH